MRVHQCSPRRFMPPEACSFPSQPALAHARPLPLFGAPFFQPPSSSSLVLSAVPPDHLPMQRMSVPLQGLADGSISCPSALPAPSTVAWAALFSGLPSWAQDSPGCCSTNFLAGRPPQPGDSALRPQFLLGPPKKIPCPCGNVPVGSPELASLTSAPWKTRIGLLLKSVAGCPPNSFLATVELVPQVEPPTTSLCSPPARTS
ncbi:uncharacterized protein LOC120317791 isoform X1 [Crotalus tigris]|uniref:uncharacterized protein LOC120317791 isoform X1 n=1 Tax=Crotalus tigris TaxID=88082 RepID=UPI00192F344F|nr:uncharacterized protein LOC120317791 isoform X1 [Crotalus tigris]